MYLKFIGGPYETKDKISVTEYKVVVFLCFFGGIGPELIRCRKKFET